ncbi:MAG: ribulose-phosphate 3-epimerase [Candidatus Omnitrophota bacterium]|nr:MAG: ribulose-phosphate 3-epimerase [Candidatus Omnitrophota bacterium]
MANNLLISSSILSADFSCLGKEAQSIEKAGADLLHIDVMDGHFVPNITIGPAVVESLSRKIALPLDVHLMITDPVFFLDQFIKAGSAIITVHIEVCSIKQIKQIRKKLSAHNLKLGVSLNPDTPVEKLYPILEITDMVLVMSVNPGFGGQAFIDKVLPKIRLLRKIYPKDIEVDGGINARTARMVAQSGANIIVSGAYIFSKVNRKQAIKELRQWVK